MGVQAREVAGATERVPHVPGVPLARHILDAAAQEGVLEVRLVAGRVRAADHAVVAAHAQRGALQQRAHPLHEVRGFLAPRQHPEAARVHRVGVDHGGNARVPQPHGNLVGLVVRPVVYLVDEELHEHAAVHRLPLAATLAAVLGYVDGREAGLALGLFAHAGNRRPCAQFPHVGGSD